jgi:hypothetical protein
MKEIIMKEHDFNRETYTGHDADQDEITVSNGHSHDDSHTDDPTHQNNGQEEDAESTNNKEHNMTNIKNTIAAALIGVCLTSAATLATVSSSFAGTATKYTNKTVSETYSTAPITKGTNFTTGTYFTDDTTVAVNYQGTRSTANFSDETFNLTARLQSTRTFATDRGTAFNIAAFTAKQTSTGVCDETSTLKESGTTADGTITAFTPTRAAGTQVTGFTEKGVY